MKPPTLEEFKEIYCMFRSIYLTIAVGPIYPQSSRNSCKQISIEWSAHRPLLTTTAKYAPFFSDSGPVDLIHLSTVLRLPNPPGTENHAFSGYRASRPKACEPSAQCQLWSQSLRLWLGTEYPINESWWKRTRDDDRICCDSMVPCAGNHVVLQDVHQGQIFSPVGLRSFYPCPCLSAPSECWFLLNIRLSTFGRSAVSLRNFSTVDHYSQDGIMVTNSTWSLMWLVRI